MNPSDTAEVAEIAKSAAFAHDAHPDEKRDRISAELRPATSPEIEVVRETAEKGGFSSSAAYEDDAALQKDFPSPDELRTLRRVSGKIPWTAYTVAFVELCERFSYYGTTAVCTFVTTPLYLPTNIDSRQLHPTSASRRFIYRCNSWSRQSGTRCFGHGTASFHWTDLM